MTHQQKLRWFYFLMGLYAVVNSIAIAFEIYYLFLTPVVIGLGFLLVLSIDKFLLFTTLLVPFSVDIASKDVGFAVSIPSEPLIIILALGFAFKAFIEQSVDGRIFRHPITICILIYLSWIGITAATSTMPIVSFKFLASRLWFILPFYFLGVSIFKKGRLANDFNWMYIFSMLGVIGYTIYQHSQWNFEKDPAHWVMTPFYYDHTQYGAMLAFFIPFLTAFSLRNKLPLFLRILVFATLAAFLVALILSNSRAAWLSVLVAAALFLVIYFRIKWYIALSPFLVAYGYFVMNQTAILQKLEKNKQDSSGDFNEHIQSMSNISTDASNLERLLRWNCALRMYKEKPIFGWGPGTYMFQYAPFQRSYELTIISTNFGDGGNAHSEYLGPLAEQGLPGMIWVLLLVLVVSWVAIKTYYRVKDPYVRRTLIAVYLGLVTYWVHGTLNNFLDTDKAAVPYWGSIAIITAISMYAEKIPSAKTSDA